MIGDLTSLIVDATRTHSDCNMRGISCDGEPNLEPRDFVNNDMSKDFYTLMEDMEAKLYPECRTFYFTL